MYLTVIHPFGAYQPGDVIPAADAAAILASENAANVVLSQAPDVTELAAEPELPAAPEPAPQPESEPAAPAFAFAASVPYVAVPFVAVSDNDPS